MRGQSTGTTDHNCAIGTTWTTCALLCSWNSRISFTSSFFEESFVNVLIGAWSNFRQCGVWGAADVRSPVSKDLAEAKTLGIDWVDWRIFGEPSPWKIAPQALSRPSVTLSWLSWLSWHRESPLMVIMWFEVALQTPSQPLNFPP